MTNTPPEARTLLVDKVGALTKATPLQYETAKYAGKQAADAQMQECGRTDWNHHDLALAAVMRDADLAAKGLY